MPPESFNLRYISTKSSRFAEGTLRTAFPTNQSKQSNKLKIEFLPICLHFFLQTGENCVTMAENYEIGGCHGIFVFFGKNPLARAE